MENLYRDLPNQYNLAWQINQAAYDAMKAARRAIKTAMVSYLRANGNIFEYEFYTNESCLVPWKDGKSHEIKVIELIDEGNNYDIKFTFDNFTAYLREIEDNSILMEILTYLKTEIKIPK